MSSQNHNEMYSTNTPRVFHVETMWKRPFPRRFNVEYMWCVYSRFDKTWLLLYPKDHIPGESRNLKWCYFIWW